MSQIKKSNRKNKKRREKRRFEVRYGLGEPEFKGYTANISPSGLMIRAIRVYAPGSRLNLEMRFNDKVFKVQAQVRWARRGNVQFLQTGRIGMGLRFLQPDEELIKAIEALKAGSAMRSS